ncbi:MAG: TonB-dependent receptor [Bacteroidales bacterium]|nr:TonB-dependent receptor [Bacteroidales bacterium]
MKKFSYILILLSCAFQTAVAQNVVRVKGCVASSEDSQPLPGAGVICSSGGGTITDLDGIYFIDCKAGDILTYSTLGYGEQTFTVPQGLAEVIHDVVLDPETTALDETVVVAYGVRKKGTIAGSVSAVKSDKIADVPAAGFDQALQGQSPGLTVLSNSGEPSKPSTFQIRGTNSINSGTAPLFILDGVPISSSDFNSISPGDIESVSVLKDASSSSIYGARAANGVIVITTRRGVDHDKARINFRSQAGISQIACGKWNLMNTAERIQFEKEIGMDEGQKYDVLSQTDVNWLDAVFNDRAALQNYELSVSRAGDNFNYFISGGYYDQDGIAQGSTFRRYSFRSNVEGRMNSWLRMGSNTMIAFERIEQADEGSYALYTPISASRFMLPYWNPFREDGSIASSKDGSWKGTTLNPVEWMDNNPQVGRKFKLIETAFAEISILDNLRFRCQGGADYTNSTTLMRSFPSFTGNNGSGAAGRAAYNSLNLTITNTLTWNFNIDSMHDFNFLLGQEGVDSSSEGFQVISVGQNNDYLTDLSSGTRVSSWADSFSSYSYLSFFGRGEYNYAGRYYADFSVRADASSRFGKGSRWAPFWSVGAMWNARQESFLKDAAWLSDARLTFSTGTSGNSSIPDYDHLALVNGGVNYGGDAGIFPAQRGNEKLSWEKLWTTNLGIHLGVLQRVNLTAEFYNKLTTDMLMAVPVSYSGTGEGFVWDNVGAMVNRGVELDFGADLVRVGGFVWNVSANVSYNRNKITGLYNGLDEYEMSTTGTKLVVGHSVGEYFMNRYAGVNPANGDALWYDKDGNITGEFNASDKVMTGVTYIAPWQGGFATALSWKGIALNAQFSWVADRYVFNNDRYFEESNGLYSAYNQSRRILYDRWKNPGDITDIPRYGVTPQMDSRFLENASFLRLKNLSLSYSLPQALLARTRFLTGTRIYLQGQNLLTFTNFSGLDPENSSNIYAAQYPMSRQITAGIEISF